MKSELGKAATCGTLITTDALGEVRYNYKSVNPLAHRSEQLLFNIINTFGKTFPQDSLERPDSQSNLTGKSLVITGSTLVKTQLDCIVKKIS